ncbi:MAG TPA: hypothetical protein VF735_07405 [Pyrinomonadaceae bacterium]
MAKYTSPLDHVTVAAPCPADWDAMIGNERARFCGQCRLNVYNLSGMTKREAEALIASAEGRLCIRFYRRADGTILTKNCPVGLRALKRRLSRVAGAALSAVLSFFAGLGLHTALDEREPVFMMGKTAMRREPPVNATMGTTAVELPRPFNGPVHRGGLISGRMRTPEMGEMRVGPPKERASK